MWDQPCKSSRSHQKQGSYSHAAPRYISQVHRSNWDTHQSDDYISSPTDSSSDYITPTRGTDQDSPPNHRHHVNRAMNSEHAAQTGNPRQVYGFSQPHPSYPPRPSGRPRYRAQSPDSDCIAQDSQSDEDYIATPEVKRDAWRNREASYNDRYNDDSPRNSSPGRHSPSAKYSYSPPSDYAPHPKAKSDRLTVKEGWGNSHSFTQSHRLNPRERENYREAKQFLNRFQKLRTHNTDRSDTESYSDGSPSHRQNRSHERYPNRKRDDEDYYAPIPPNYRESHHNQRTRLRSQDRRHYRPDDDDDDDDVQHNDFEPRPRNANPHFSRPAPHCPDSEDDLASSFSARPPRHVNRSSSRPGSVYSDRQQNNIDTTAYSDIASRPSSSHSDRLSRVPTAVDSEDFSSPPPSVPSPPVYRRQRRSGSDYGAIPGSFPSRSRSRSISRDAYVSGRSARSTSPYSSSPVRSTHYRDGRRNVSYRSDSDDNGIAEGSDYLPSDSGDDERISLGGRRRNSRSGNGGAEGSDYLSSVNGRSDVCEKDGWRSRGCGREEGYASDGVEGGVASGRSYGRMW